ncbi:GGDEF domain-containing protein [Acidaminobacter sp. JC074]|uniref:GGDEF domain-containing protein n=1 Tax=Acidaminobacter sp. JC074 TaxID=2530199 RepID=UPI001F10CF0F|nr:diguanylate cyclase [Acidaminobacter sp. JC074]MCH4890021.1 GGDEF domain-containing protein [Acidaminobacter sp. JC074]
MKKINSTMFIRLFALLFIVTLFVVLVIQTVYEYSLISETKDIMIEEEQVALSTIKKVIGNDLKNVVSDLEFMKLEMISHHDESFNYDHVWCNFIKSKKFYDQIRFIDVSGKELVRVNYDDGHVDIVPEDQLQNKSDRYYFKEAIDLEPNTFHISDLDLNVENGEIEQPEKPMLRIALRVKEEDFDGVLIVNYLAEHLLDEIDIINENTKGSIYLINESSDYLYHEDGDKAFKFMYPGNEAINFCVDYPLVCDNYNKDYLISDGQLFIVESVNFDEVVEIDRDIVVTSGQLRLVDHVGGDDYAIYFDTDLMTVVKNVIIKYRYSVIIIFFATLLISYLQYRIRKSKLIVRELFEKDALTNIYNRRAGMQYFTKLIDETKLTGEEVCVIFIDVDGLKQINDTLGHEYGDDLLTTVTFVVKEEIREKDLFMRLGGDEFLVVLSNIDSYITEKIMSRIEDKLESINVGDEKKYIMSISHGIASTKENDTLSIEKLISISDQRMYNNKNLKSKRNMIK